MILLDESESNEKQIRISIDEELPAKIKVVGVGGGGGNAVNRILDVRTIEEFKAGAIQGAKNIPLSQIHARIGEIKKWGAPVICYCRSGARSGSAASILRNHGIEAMNGGGLNSLNKKL